MSRGGNAQTRRRERRAANRSVALGVDEAQDQVPDTTITDETLSEIAALAAVAAEPEPTDVAAAAMSGECANCGHMAIAHAGDSNSGACSMKGCDCTGMEAAAVADEAFVIEPMTATTGNNVTWQFTFDQNMSTLDAANLVLTYAAGVVEQDAAAPELPDEHQAGQTMPRRHASPKAPATTLLDPSAALKWTATLAPEGRATDDGRIFAPGSITWRELPLSLMAMTKTADGHDGAEIAGRIDRIWRDENNMIRGAGEFTSDEFGAKIAGLVSDGTLRGVSVDIAPQKVDIAYRDSVVDEDGVWIDQADDAEANEPSMLDLLLGESAEPVIYVVREAVLGMATVRPFQAFADATIEIGDSSLAAAASPMIWTVTSDAGWIVTAKPRSMTASADPAPDDPTVALTASAAGLAPDHPPADWFHAPEFDELTALTVDEDGRVFGHAAAWATCHIGLPGGCRTAPHSNTNYPYFHLKEVECEDGSRVACGTITLDANHAQQDLGRQAAAAHYDHTGTAIADVTVGEDDYGIWVVGALRADVDADKARKLRGAVLSGDWRNVNGNLELVALLAVNVPGFPVPRRAASLVAAADGSLEPMSLVAAGIHNGVVALTDDEKAQVEALAAFARGDFDEFAVA